MGSYIGLSHFQSWSLGLGYFELPKFSTDIAAARAVVEKLKDKFSFVGPCSEGWNAVFILKKDPDTGATMEYVGGVGETAPHAICLAALVVALAGARE